MMKLSFCLVACLALAQPQYARAATPTSIYLSATGNANKMTVGGKLQFAAHCVWPGAPTTDCSSLVTEWTTSNPAMAAVGAAGSATAGLVTALAAGTPYIQAKIGSVPSSRWDLTLSGPILLNRPSSVTVSTTGDVPGVLVGQANQLIVACAYAGTAGPCQTAVSFDSAHPAVATVSTAGVLTGVATGTANVTATVGGVTSLPLPLAVIQIPPGPYAITISGPFGTVTGTLTIP